MMTGSEGVSFLLPQDFFSQQRLNSTGKEQSELQPNLLIFQFFSKIYLIKNALARGTVARREYGYGVDYRGEGLGECNNNVKIS
jgi:hypothetical protein